MDRRSATTGRELREENMRIWLTANALYLWFYLLLWGLLHDVLVRLAGFNNTHYKPNTLRDRQQFSDHMYFKLHLSSPSTAEVGKRMF